MNGTGGRAWWWCCLFIIASLLMSGCKTWSYAAKHRGIRTIVYDTKNVPIDNVDLDSPFFAAKTSFSTNEQPAIVLSGVLGRCRLELIDLQTGKLIQKKSVSLHWSTATIQPLEIQKPGEYKACFDFPDDKVNSFRFSVDRPASGTNSTSTNLPATDPFRLNALQLGLNPQKASKNYDAVFVDSIQQSWYELVDRHTNDFRGIVILQFRLNASGGVSDMRIKKNTAGNTGVSLCEQAITKAALNSWPETVREQIGKDYRDIQFTFHY